MSGSARAQGSGEPGEAAPEQWPAPTIASVPIGPGLASVAPVEIPKRRLHPLTPLLESFRLLIAVVVASSWQVYVQENFRIGVVIAIIAGVFGAGSGLLSWLFTGYRIIGGELQITEGVLVRKSRTLPLERLQGIEVAQPLRARVFGLAQLRIEVAGATETEAPLSYLRLDEARGLREQLLALSGGGGVAAVAADTAGEAEIDPAEPIVRVSVRRLIAGTVLETLPVTLLIFGFFFALGAGFHVLLELSGTEPEVWQVLSLPFVFGLVTSLLQTGASFLRNWNFTLTRSDGRLRVERGLAEKRSNIVPLWRVTAVSVAVPALWRLKDWRAVQVSTASLAQASEQLAGSDVLLPVGTVAEAGRVAATALPDIEWEAAAALPVRPPKRARWRMPFTWRIRGAGLGERVFAIRFGLLRTTTMVVPYARIQQVEVTQGPLQRVQRLATVRARIAGSASFNAVAAHRDAAEAVAMAAALRERADAAASAEEPRLS